MNRKQRRQSAGQLKRGGGTVGIAQVFAAAMQQHQAGRLKEAAALYRRVLASRPEHGEALHMLGVLANQTDDYETAVRLLRKATAVAPDQAPYHYNLGEALRSAGRFDQAAESYRRAIALAPDVADIHYGLGNALYELGDREAARSSYERAIALAPGDAEACNNLGNVLLDLGETAAAADSYRRAVAIRPDYADAHVNSGNVLRALDNAQAALESYDRALAIEPELAGALLGKGSVLQDIGQAEEALTYFERAVASDPGLIDARISLGRALEYEGRISGAIAQFEQALELGADPAAIHKELSNAFLRASQVPDAEAHAREALALAPDDADALNRLGTVLMEAGDFDDAIEIFERALALEPDLVAAIANIGNCLQQQGKFEEAAAYHRRALGLDPTLVQALYNLATSKQAVTDEAVADAESLATEGQLPEDKMIDLQFALAAIHESRKDHDRAFGHFKAANDIRKRKSKFDPDAWSAFVERLIAVYDREFYTARPDYGSTSGTPVFVVGMPRSGTTLVEQILASHPAVHGAGELQDLRDIELSLPERLDGGPAYPECAGLLDREAAADIADKHIERLAALDPQSKRIVDKMPVNFVRLGLIALLFPGSAIIHCRRNPVDTCLSCYFQNFRRLEFTTDLAHIGAFYREYARLMEHWRKELPIQILDVRYEDMVADQEAQTRRLIDFVGLEWDDRCLEFHKTERQIRTASVWQARQPIYTSSVARWRRYEAHLDPLLTALGPLSRDASPDNSPTT